MRECRVPRRDGVAGAAGILGVKPDTFGSMTRTPIARVQPMIDGRKPRTAADQRSLVSGDGRRSPLVSVGVPSTRHACDVNLMYPPWRADPKRACRPLRALASREWTGNAKRRSDRLLCYINEVDRVVRWYRSARRHRIGGSHALHVMATTEPEHVPAAGDFDARLVWIGPDDRGVELEVVALDLPDAVVVIHVFPIELRREP